MKSAISFADLLRVVAMVPRVEIGRRFRGPSQLLPALRRRGARAAIRSATARVGLRRVIWFVDRLLTPRGGDCYRRALLEVALDPQAAAEPLMIGLRAGGRTRSGHVWLGSATTEAPAGVPGARLGAEDPAFYDCVVSV